MSDTSSSTKLWSDEVKLIDKKTVVQVPVYTFGKRKFTETDTKE